MMFDDDKNLVDANAMAKLPPLLYVVWNLIAFILCLGVLFKLLLSANMMEKEGRWAIRVFLTVSDLSVTTVD